MERNPDDDYDIVYTICDYVIDYSCVCPQGDYWEPQEIFWYKDRWGISWYWCDASLEWLNLTPTRHILMRFDADYRMTEITEKEAVG